MYVCVRIRWLVKQASGRASESAPRESNRANSSLDDKHAISFQSTLVSLWKTNTRKKQGPGKQCAYEPAVQHIPALDGADQTVSG